MLDAQDLDDPEISALKKQLLSLVSSRGLTESDELTRLLGWDAESYWYIGGLLIRAGLLRPEGKKLERVAASTRESELESQRVIARRSEKSLYEPIIETLSSAWVLEHRLQDYVIDLTASQGSRVTGGKWSRPDVTLASSNEYKYVPGQFVEVRTFEIKTYEGSRCHGSLRSSFAPTCRAFFACAGTRSSVRE
jgi:hypothetical protein